MNIKINNQNNFITSTFTGKREEYIYMMINRKELIRIEYIIYDSKSLKTPPRIIKINKARKMEMKEIILNVKEIKLSSFFENHIIEDLIFKDLKYTKATTIKMIKVK